MARKTKINVSKDYFKESANSLNEEFMELFKDEDDDKKAIIQKIMNAVPVPLTKADQFQINILADSLLIYSQIMKLLKEQGLQTRTSQGIKVTDLVTKRGQVIKEITSIGSSFGLDMASRHGLLASTIEEEENKHDPVLQLIGDLKGA